MRFPLPAASTTAARDRGDLREATAPDYPIRVPGPAIDHNARTGDVAGLRSPVS
jgi:hypothetical protein